ncbi:MAG TPA: hypothetical protein VFD70_19025 [Anaerolineae bacterium]|nr:hypothetical protein [Anaerolineae bacterium]
MRFSICVLVLLLAFVAGCGTNPTPPPATSLPPAPIVNAPATETAIAQRIFATLTASAPSPQPLQPTLAATVTPPPAPNTAPTSAPPPTNEPTVIVPTLSLALSPSITPLPTIVPTIGPTLTPTQVPLQITREGLLGKILFKSARGEREKYPSSYQYYVMNADGSGVQQVDKKAAQSLADQLKPLEGYSPDKSLLVLGELTCRGGCRLYLGPPEVIKNRSQGEWISSGSADNPVWSPAGNWIAFTWNRDNNGTKNIFKGDPSKTNQDFKKLTDFGGKRDTKFPTYSPDGSQLAFATQDGPRWQIWVLNANADNPIDANAHNLSNSEFDDWDPLWIK